MTTRPNVQRPLIPDAWRCCSSGSEHEDEAATIKANFCSETSGFIGIPPTYSQKGRPCEQPREHFLTFKVYSQVISLSYLTEMPLVSCSDVSQTQHVDQRVEHHEYLVSGGSFAAPTRRNLEHFCNHYFIFLQSQPGRSLVHQTNNQCFACLPVCVPSISVVLESRKVKKKTKGKRSSQFSAPK